MIHVYDGGKPSLAARLSRIHLGGWIATRPVEVNDILKLWRLNLLSNGKAGSYFA